MNEIDKLTTEELLKELEKRKNQNVKDSGFVKKKAKKIIPPG